MAREDSIPISGPTPCPLSTGSTSTSVPPSTHWRSETSTPQPGTAVDAGINAADAVAGVNLGRRWKGAHEQAVQFVAGGGIEGKDAARNSRRLTPPQDAVALQLGADDAVEGDACVEAARRLLQSPTAGVAQVDER